MANEVIALGLPTGLTLHAACYSAALSSLGTAALTETPAVKLGTKFVSAFELDNETVKFINAVAAVLGITQIYVPSLGMIPLPLSTGIPAGWSVAYNADGSGSVTKNA